MYRFMIHICTHELIYSTSIPAFSRFLRYCQTLTMGKGFGRSHKHIQKHCPYPSLNTTFVVLPSLLFTSQHDSTNYYGILVKSHNQPSPVSNLTSTTQFDNGSNNYYDTHSIETPMKNITTPLKYLKIIIQILRFRIMLIPIHEK